MLQAYIDDSASELGDKRLFLAGYVGTAPLWAQFSDAWARELQAHPAIEYLHMVEAQNLRCQFQGWSEPDRDRKVLALASIIPAHVVCSVQVSVSRAEYDQIIRPIAPYNLRNPYFICFVGVLFTLSRALHDALEDAPTIDFIFDEHSLGRDAVMWYDYLKTSLPPGPRRLLGGPPIFRDDKKVVALQSADMLAWHLRRQSELRDETKRQALDTLLSGGLHIVADVDAEQLKRQAAKMRKIPGIGGVRSKGDWQKVRKGLLAIMAAGRTPPSINRAWLYWLSVRVRTTRIIKRLKRMLR